MKGILHKGIGCAILLLCVVAIVRAGESRPFHGQYVEKVDGQPKRLESGQPSFNFRYLDVNGKWVSLKDLKGKYVYIDVWATWCGPCKAEIPYLKALEKEMKRKKIVFVSISIDENKKEWKTFVEMEKLGGIQLYAGKVKDLVSFYGIDAIPRFILLDKKGNIVNAFMTRPSDKKTKETLMILKGI
ncbi:TlpA family protein disulfide reductase [Butyricimonas paravirosa]|uniref:TlpA family protein disulfide reductase n=1 Tax=Butyricimonas paravirosa TaxID=1472417 RepID=UPI0026DEED43|nr:TlpA disulfide reductase family protein [Butyricimonas paravirosa]